MLPIDKRLLDLVLVGDLTVEPEHRREREGFPHGLHWRVDVHLFDVPENGWLELVSSTVLSVVFSL